MYRQQEALLLQTRRHARWQHPVPLSFC